MMKPDHSPSAERNKHPILEHLLQLLPAQGSALEIASGTGQHVQWFAQHLPAWTWQPSEAHAGALYNIEARLAQADLDNVLSPLQLDVCQEPWFTSSADAQAPRFDLILCINMLHIAPWAACGALMHGAAQYLTPTGLLITYGPYFEDDRPDITVAPSNQAFDESLRAHNPSWGIRQRREVEAQAQAAQLRLHQRHTMPANNLLLVWQRQ